MNTDRLWSYSRIDKYLTCEYAYYMRYIMREPEDSNGVYLLFGSAIHDALEKFYEGEQPYEFINQTFNTTRFETIDLAGLKFNNSDEDKNSAIETKYLACLEHFSKNHKPTTQKVASEQFILTNITEDNATEHFMGYIDAVHIELEKDADGKDIEGTGTVIVTDYKTSTRYTGAKIAEHANQLILNSLGISQSAGVPMDRIKARWNFLKYVTVSYVMKNKKVKDTICERHNWVGNMEVSLRAKLKESGVGDELERDIMILKAISTNSLANMPESVQEAYTFDDAYVYVDLSPTNIAKVKIELMRIMKEIRVKELSKDASVWEVEVTDSKSYFCTQLCGYRDKCPCYQEYAEQRNMFMTNPESKEDGEIIRDTSSWLTDMFAN